MFLKISSIDKPIYEGAVKEVVVPTASGQIGILPGHVPLASVVVPGVVKITPIEDISSIKENAGYSWAFENEDIYISVGGGLIYVDGENIVMTVSSAGIDENVSKQMLEDMKKQLENKLKEIKDEADIEDFEYIAQQLQKIEADMKILKIKGVSS